MNYIAVIHKDQDTGYGASFPEVGGCTAVSDTLEGIIEEAKNALSLYLETLKELGRDIPEPKGIDYVLKNSVKTGFVMVAMIPVILNDNVVRINITVPERYLHRIDEAAKRKNMSRSAFLTEAALQSIDA